ncbi:MAG TPA: hypothetical protein VEB18_01910 [Candidatus Paceibacterota bacterium]|nr:hypothetical protein [Candidatus Paceibacterota bacterium]
MPTSRTSVILLILGLLVLGAAAYLLFGTNNDAAVSPNGAPGSEAEMAFLSLTAQIDPVEFDTGILDDPRFNALQDIQTAIVPESSGRADPFAPLGR